jgi:hypothetical protein
LKYDHFLNFKCFCTEISELILGKIHMTEARKVVKHITAKHFVDADAIGQQSSSPGLKL